MKRLLISAILTAVATASLGVSEVKAETAGEEKAGTAYERGIWYDLGSGPAKISSYKSEVEKLFNQGIRRVHVVISESIAQKSINCSCTHADEVKTFIYRDLTDDHKMEIANRYKACLIKNVPTNKFCAFADNYRFEFDKWGKFKRLLVFLDQLNKKNMDVILDIWPSPNTRYIDSIKGLVRNVVVRKFKIYGIELEDEENWSEVYTTDGLKSELDQSAHNILTALRSSLPDTVKLGVTTGARGFNDDKLNDDKLLTDPLVEFISFQAYQDTYKNNSCVTSEITGDSSPQHLASRSFELLERLKSLRDKNIITGLSAYQLDCPPKPNASGISGVINMYKAAKNTACAAIRPDNDKRAYFPHIIGDAYYSEDNIVKARKHNRPYAHDFLSLCRAVDLRQHCDEVDFRTDNEDNDETTLSQLNRDCPDVVYDLVNHVTVVPGATRRVPGDIYIYGNHNK